ncbi:MAG: hypothetical protein HRF46_09900 [Acidobacteriota bacterium]|jgi:hypothetical protein
MKRPIRFILLGLLLGVVAGAVFLAIEVRAFYRRALQVRTFADMQTITARMNAAIDSGERSQAKLFSLVQSVNQGRDAWGRDYVFDLQATAAGIEYVLISRGSDGKLDLSDVSAYFTLSEADIKYQYSRDIVFRDGVAVTRAGK